MVQLQSKSNTVLTLILIVIFVGLIYQGFYTFSLVRAQSVELSLK